MSIREAKELLFVAHEVIWVFMLLRLFINSWYNHRIETGLNLT